MWLFCVSLDLNILWVNAILYHNTPDGSYSRSKSAKAYFFWQEKQKKTNKKTNKKEKIQKLWESAVFFFVVLHLVWTHKQTLKSFSLTSTKMWAGGEGRVGLSGGKGGCRSERLCSGVFEPRLTCPPWVFLLLLFPLSLNKTKKIPKKMSKHRWNGIPTNIPQTCRAIVKLYS